MKINGLIHQLPRAIKALVFVFVLILNIGYFGGLAIVDTTTSMSTDGIESHYLGNENDDSIQEMKFKKSKTELLTLVHNHILSMGVLFFLFGLILATTNLNSKWKLFLIIEPFISIILTFGGLYLLWLGITWFKFIVMISGLLMTLCFVTGSIIILWQLRPNMEKR
jgi:hypothetical protein